MVKLVKVSNTLEFVFDYKYEIDKAMCHSLFLKKGSDRVGKVYCIESRVFA